MPEDEDLVELHGFVDEAAEVDDDEADDDDDDDESTTQYPYPIDEHMQEDLQAKLAAMRAKDPHRLAIGTRYYDFSNPISVEAFFAELGEDAVRPEDNGVYILLWVKTDAEEEPVPYLKHQSEVLSFIQGIAARDSVTTAQQFADRPGFLPLHDPVLDA